MKHDFRIKLQGDSRAVSYKNIEANLMQYNNYIDVKGVKTMIRQYLKSMYKDVYKLPIKFKYKKTDGILEVVIDGIKQPNFGKLIKAFDQFTYENSPKTDIKSGKELSFLVSRINLFNGTPFETPNATPTTTPAPESAPQSSSGLPKATRIYIHTHEGTGEFDNMIFKTWSDLQNALKKIYDNWSTNPYGYDKVKVEIEWENGKKLLDRIDVGDDFKPYQTFIGEYLKEQNGAMFSSNFDKRPSPDDRDSVSWTDEVDEDTQSESKPKIPLDEIIIKNIRQNTSTGFKTWNDADIYLEEQSNQMPEDAKWQYKIRVYWKNNVVISKLITLGKAYDEYDVANEYLGIYLYNIEINETWDEKKDELQWDDDDVVQSEAIEQPEQPEQPEQQPMQTNKLPISNIEIYDAKKSKLLKSFTNWTDADNYFESIWTKMKPQTTKDYSVYIYWGGVQVSAHTIVTLNSDEYYPDGNDDFYDRFLVNWFYSYTDTDYWKNVRDTLQWIDSDETPNETPQSQPQQTQNQTQMPQNSITLNLVGYTNYILTESEIETIYGVDWRKLEKLDWIDELDYTLGTMINENKAMQLINNGTLSVEIDGLDYTIPVEATTLACYKDYNDLSAQEIDEIIDGLKIYLEIGVGVSEERKNAYEVM